MMTSIKFGGGTFITGAGEKFDAFCAKHKITAGEMGGDPTIFTTDPTLETLLHNSLMTEGIPFETTPASSLDEYDKFYRRPKD